ncbi:putative serine/threonine-protein kinase [Phytophthora citrophthora]|uniref:Serine/threonine-protein kinase n=1 Tax=Phytophthora citrophthora TaxID=4793 RepID=A0AAD9GSW1_9STRA|nr:putative serine/threonine-protein kinase [Phytophthora citrophthora]
MADFTSTPETLVGLPPTYESDVYTFGLLLVDAITKGARCSGGVYDSDDTNDAILCGKLPNKPEVMTTSQRQLIERMCRYNPSDRPTMTDIVRELEGFSKATLTSEEFCTG